MNFLCIYLGDESVCVCVGGGGFALIYACIIMYGNT